MALGFLQNLFKPKAPKPSAARASINRQAEAFFTDLERPQQPSPPTPEPQLPPDLRHSHDEFLLSGEWMIMASSNVHAMRYLYDDQILEVEYKWGGFYQYTNVDPNLVRRFIETDSPGRFVWNHIRDVYDYTLLTGPTRKIPKAQQKPNVIRVLRPRKP